jgi:hypothetical protein
VRAYVVKPGHDASSAREVAVVALGRPPHRAHGGHGPRFRRSGHIVQDRSLRSVGRTNIRDAAKYLSLSGNQCCQGIDQLGASKTTLNAMSLSFTSCASTAPLRLTIVVGTPLVSTGCPLIAKAMISSK